VHKRRSLLGIPSMEGLGGTVRRPGLTCGNCEARSLGDEDSTSMKLRFFLQSYFKKHSIELRVYELDRRRQVLAWR
jgi:hypothetical protein